MSLHHFQIAYGIRFFSMCMFLRNHQLAYSHCSNALKSLHHFQIAYNIHFLSICMFLRNHSFSASDFCHVSVCVSEYKVGPGARPALFVYIYSSCILQRAPICYQAAQTILLPSLTSSHAHLPVCHVTLSSYIPCISLAFLNVQVSVTFSMSSVSSYYFFLLHLTHVSSQSLSASPYIHIISDHVGQFSQYTYTRTLTCDVTF